MKKRIFYLDFIRAISTIFIVAFHFNTSLVGHSIYGRKILFQIYSNGDLGQIGVSLFIIISGASLTYANESNVSFKKFFKKRVFSIYPMYWTAYVIAFLYFFYIRTRILPDVPKWTFLLTILGVDGYFKYRIPNFYILGEWFFGFIIIMYAIYPFLRKLLNEHKNLLLISVLTIYVIIIQNYDEIFKLGFNRNILTRLPELLFGMYFIQYLKKVKNYQFLLAISICICMFFIHINLHQMYKITVMGISMFFVLAYIGLNIKNEIIEKPFVLISKYSFAIFLVHHVIIEQLLIKFNGKQLTSIETFCLFIINCIIIVLISLCIYRLTNKITNCISEIKFSNCIISKNK